MADIFIDAEKVFISTWICMLVTKTEDSPLVTILLVEFQVRQVLQDKEQVYIIAFELDRHVHNIKRRHSHQQYITRIYHS